LSFAKNFRYFCDFRVQEKLSVFAPLRFESIKNKEKTLHFLAIPKKYNYLCNRYTDYANYRKN